MVRTVKYRGYIDETTIHVDHRFPTYWGVYGILLSTKPDFQELRSRITEKAQLADDKKELKWTNNTDNKTLAIILRAILRDIKNGTLHFGLSFYNTKNRNFDKKSVRKEAETCHAHLTHSVSTLLSHGFNLPDHDEDGLPINADVVYSFDDLGNALLEAALHKELKQIFEPSKNDNNLNMRFTLRDSDSMLYMQLVDIMIGAVAWHMNGGYLSPQKRKSSKCPRLRRTRSELFDALVNDFKLCFGDDFDVADRNSFNRIFEEERLTNVFGLAVNPNIPQPTKDFAIAAKEKNEQDSRADKRRRVEQARRKNPFFILAQS